MHCIAPLLGKELEMQLADDGYPVFSHEAGLASRDDRPTEVPSLATQPPHWCVPTSDDVMMIEQSDCATTRVVADDVEYELRRARLIDASRISQCAARSSCVVIMPVGLIATNVADVRELLVTPNRCDVAVVAVDIARDVVAGLAVLSAESSQLSALLLSTAPAKSSSSSQPTALARKLLTHCVRLIARRPVLSVIAHEHTIVLFDELGFVECKRGGCRCAAAAASVTEDDGLSGCSTSTSDSVDRALPACILPIAELGSLTQREHNSHLQSASVPNGCLLMCVPSERLSAPPIDLAV